MYSGSRPRGERAHRPRQPAPSATAPSPPTAPLERRGPRRRPAACHRGVLAGDHHGLGHARAGSQHRLDLARLDPEPADLHLVISPARRTPATPPAVHRARSPVRYIRSPPAPNGHATNRSPVSPGRPRYPRASPAPATYNSPVTPAGTGHSHSSSTYTRVLASGRPIGTATAQLQSAGRTRCVVVNVVVSVGPYRFTSRHRPPPARSTTPAAAAADSTSPAQPADSAQPRPAPPASRVHHQMEQPSRQPQHAHPLRRHRTATAAPAPTAPPPERPPAPRRWPAHPRSQTSPRQTTPTTPGPRHRRHPAPQHPPCRTSRSTPRCVTTTPFGRPVDPDVYITYAA